MSYIFDQLKQSGKKREIEMRLKDKAGQAEKIKPISHADAAGNERRPFLRPSMLFISAAVIALSLFAVFRYRTGTGVNRPVPAQAVKQAAPEKISRQPVDLKQPANKENAGIKAEVPAPAEKTVQQKELPSTRVVKSPVPAEERPAKVSDRAVPAAAAVNPPSENLYSGPRDLPASARKDLPEIKISSHIYRKDSKLVSINGRIMTEGSNIGNGLYLQEITPEGVIISYGKYIFHMKAE
jgi:general secretion pathway protein B